MSTKKNINRILGSLFVLMALNVTAQTPSIYKIDNLLKRIRNNSDTLYVVNFWATWCKPCVAELPDFEKINLEYKDQKVKVLLVSLDFKEDLKGRLIPFLQKAQYTSEVVLLDESNANEFIDAISKQWTGAIPATLFTKRNNSVSEFFEKKLHYDFLVEQIAKFK